MAKIRASIIEILTIFFFLSSLFIPSSSAFQSDELLQDDDEFGLEGGRPSILDPDYINPIRPIPTIRKRSSADHQDSDSKVHFSLEHAFGDSDFLPAGTFTARLKSSNHGGQLDSRFDSTGDHLLKPHKKDLSINLIGTPNKANQMQTLTKLRFSREDLTDLEKEKFEKLVQDDDFYKIRIPSNVLSPPGKDYVISSVKARCLPRNSLDEHFVIYTEGVNILGVNYGSPGTCQYPRPLRLPKKWSFNSYTVLKSTELAPRTPVFAEEILGGGESVDGEMVNVPEKSFWAKYWMYMIPLGLIIMNAVTQAMNLPEEGAGQGTAQPAVAGTAVRRR